MKKLYRLTALMLALLMLCASALAEATEAPAQTEAAETEAVETEAAEPEAAEAQTGEATLPDPEEVEALEAEAEVAEASAETAAAPVELWFDAGFALTLPGDWVSYDVADADKASGLEYALGDGSGERYLYIYLTPTTLEDFDAVSGAVEADAALSRTGSLSFDGADFVSFIDAAQNASCCATRWGDSLLTFCFTPQDVPDFMLTATQIMESFRAQ